MLLNAANISGSTSLVLYGRNVYKNLKLSLRNVIICFVN